MVTKENQRPCQTYEMELFLLVVTDFRSELRILSNNYDESFCENSQKSKAVHYFCITSFFDVSKGSEFDSELASKIKDVSF